jgi:hypothetical protein
LITDDYFIGLKMEIVSVSYVVSVNNDVLSKVFLTSKTGVVRWGWLVHGPVVKWWVNYWV